MTQRKTLILLTLGGAAMGLAAAAILMAVATPRYGDMLLPLAQAQALQRFASLAGLLDTGSGALKWVFSALACLGALACWRCLMLQLSPPWAASSWRQDRDIFVAGLLSAAGLGFLAWIWSGMSLDLASRSDFLFLAGICAAYGALLWVLLSPLGVVGVDSSQRPAAYKKFALLLAWFFGTFAGLSLIDHLNLPAWTSLAFATLWAFGIPLFFAWRVSLSGEEAFMLDLLRPDWMATGLLGAMYGATLACILWMMGLAFQFLFTWVVEIGSGSAEPVATGAVELCLVVVGLSALASSAGLGLASAFCGEPCGMDERARRAKAPLTILASACIAGGLFYALALAHNDWGAGSLQRAAKLPDLGAAHPQTLVSFGRDKEKPETNIADWPASITPTSWGSQSPALAATLANAKALEAFLSQGKSSSRYYLSAMDTLPRIYGALWQPDDAFICLDRIKLAPEYQGQPTLLYTAISAAWATQSAPLNEVSLRKLEMFSDATRYKIPPKWCLKFAKACQRFGDHQKSAYWLAKAKAQAGSDKQLADEAAQFNPNAPSLTQGKVTGRVTLAWAPKGTPLKVGLFMASPGPKFSAYSPNANNLNFRLAAAQEIGSGDKFAFDHLTTGNYYLCLLVDRQPTLKAPKHPGFAILNPGHASHSFGEIRVELAAKTK